MKYGLIVPSQHLTLLAKALGHKNIEFGYNNLPKGQKELLLGSEADRAEARRLLTIITPIDN